MGQQYIVATLKTRDLRVAQSRRWEYVAEAHRQFEALREGTRLLSAAEVEAEAAKTFQQVLKTADDTDMDEEQCQLALGLVSARLEDGKLSELEEAKASAEFHAFHARLHALNQKVYPVPPVFSRRGIDPVTLRPVLSAFPEAAEGDLRFSEAARRYLEELQRDPEAKPTAQTVGQYEAVYRLFGDHCRDSTLANIPRATASDFISTVAKLDPMWGRSPKTKERSLSEIMERYGEHPKGLSNKTLTRYAGSLGAVFKWAKRRGLFEGDNPFEGQALKKVRSSKSGWLPFEMEELDKLLSSLSAEVSVKEHAQETALAWVTWIGAYSGMRLNEICSLNVADLRKQDGVWFFDVKEAKTEAGERRVPIHSTLIDKGLLRYRSKIKEGSMWPALKPGGPDGKLSWYLSKRFTVWRRSLGITRPRLGFHSLRKNVATALENARVPESEAVQVLGHEKLSMSYSVYSLGSGLPALKDVVEKIRYDFPSERPRPAKTSKGRAAG